jgi:hypothetical protein
VRFPIHLPGPENIQISNIARVPIKFFLSKKSSLINCVCKLLAKSAPTYREECRMFLGQGLDFERWNLKAIWASKQVPNFER